MLASCERSKDMVLGEEMKSVLMEAEVTIIASPKTGVKSITEEIIGPADVDAEVFYEKALKAMTGKTYKEYAEAVVKDMRKKRAPVGQEP